MKKLITLVMCLFLMLGLFACGDVENTSVRDGKERSLIVGETTQYTEERYLSYYWEGGTIYNESVLPLEDEFGMIAPIDLMYGIKNIVSVKDSSLKTEYKLGTDYVVDEGRLVILNGGNIPTLKHNEYFLEQPNFSLVKLSSVTGGYLLYDEHIFHKKQLAITYEVADDWKGQIPKDKTNLLPKTAEKLKSNTQLDIVFIGDSITYGASASGCIGYEMQPRMPIWTDMSVSALSNNYKNRKINSLNLAVGGTSLLGTGENDGENQFIRAMTADPDLLVIGFGMNDCASPVSAFMAKLNELIARAKKINPDIEIVLVSSMLRNNYEVYSRDAYNKNLIDYEQAMLGIETTGVAVMDMTQMHQDMLLNKTYRYYDYTGNNINHPNDFLVRAYAQVFLKTLGV